MSSGTAECVIISRRCLPTCTCMCTGDISVLSGDIIERRIQMSPELLGFPGSPPPPAPCRPPPTRSPAAPRVHGSRISVPRWQLVLSRDQPFIPLVPLSGLSPPVPWPFDAAPHPHPTVFRRTIETNRLIRSNVHVRRDDCHRKSQWPLSFLSFPFFPFFFFFPFSVFFFSFLSRFLSPSESKRRDASWTGLKFGIDGGTPTEDILRENVSRVLGDASVLSERRDRQTRGRVNILKTVVGRYPVESGSSLTSVPPFDGLSILSVCPPRFGDILYASRHGAGRAGGVWGL